MELSLPQIFAIILGSIAIVKIVAEIISYIWRPNIEQDKELVGMKKDIGSMQDDIELIKTNHLTHIQADMSHTKERLTRIETILEERLPYRK